MKRKICNLTDTSASDSSGEGEMIRQLNKKVNITGKNSEKVQRDGQLGKFNKDSKPQIT